MKTGLEFKKFLATMKITDDVWKVLDSWEQEFAIARYRSCKGKISDILDYLNNLEVKKCK
ncbi:MAG: hypothetical protein RR795_01495 [Cetobacterium sp.]|uniref:hypothetical protein n=1 Tax=Cetobacterium sp. TaxID=2071632 RepID=UPI002FCAB203